MFFPWSSPAPAGSSPSTSSTGGLSPSSTWTPALCLDIKVLAYLEGWRVMKGTMYVIGLAAHWAFNAHSSCDEGGESPQAQSKAWGQLLLYHNRGQLAAYCTERRSSLKTSPGRASVKSCAAAAGQRGSLMISVRFVKDSCLGRCTCVGAKVIPGPEKIYCHTRWLIRSLMWELTPRPNKKTIKKTPQADAWN